jgi:hypothetical protein
LSTFLIFHEFWRNSTASSRVNISFCGFGHFFQFLEKEENMVIYIYGDFLHLLWLLYIYIYIYIWKWNVPLEKASKLWSVRVAIKSGNSTNCEVMIQFLWKRLFIPMQYVLFFSPASYMYLANKLRVFLTAEAI